MEHLSHLSKQSRCDGQSCKSSPPAPSYNEVDKADVISNKIAKSIHQTKREGVLYSDERSMMWDGWMGCNGDLGPSMVAKDADGASIHLGFFSERWVGCFPSVFPCRCAVVL